MLVIHLDICNNNFDYEQYINIANELTCPGLELQLVDQEQLPPHDTVCCICWYYKLGFFLVTLTYV